MSGRTHKRIVLLVGTDGDAPHGGVLGSESTPLTQLLSDADGALELGVISLGTSRAFDGATVHAPLNPNNRSVVDRMLKALGAYSLRERLSTFPIGRLVNSIGPLAPSRVFWRTLRRHPEALAMLRRSNVAIATDLETTKAAWLAVRRGWVDDAYYDHRAVALAFDTRSPAS